MKGISEDVFIGMSDDAWMELGYRRGLGPYYAERLEVAKVQDAQRVRERELAEIARLLAGAIRRCYDPFHRSYANYGGLGRVVCDRWHDLDVGAFDIFDAIGARPGPGYSLDRIDNERGYEPGNVRWATRLEQAQNRRPQHRRTPEELRLERLRALAVQGGGIPPEWRRR